MLEDTNNDKCSLLRNHIITKRNYQSHIVNRLKYSTKYLLITWEETNRRINFYCHDFYPVIKLRITDNMKIRYVAPDTILQYTQHQLLSICSINILT